jgi:peptidoglycan hydrolase-like protein with peptidoglycan-binding domain
MARRALVILLCLLVLPTGGTAATFGSADVAALQVGLRAKRLYTGTVDGVAGPGTTDAVRRLQRRAGLVVDGIAGPATRAALGRHGKHSLGSRPIVVGSVGWDVSQLQFLLGWHGFPSGPLDGAFGPRTEGALRRFQRWAGLTPDGLLGPATLRALRAACPTSPIGLSWPLDVPVTDGFGPRGNRFHTGVDFPAPAGTPVGAAANGRVTYAGWLDGGWGYVVTLAHGSGMRTLYAHLSSVDVKLGDQVAAAARIGLVGATGRASGPHLHFEVRLRGAAVDPLPAFS